MKRCCTWITHLFPQDDLVEYVRNPPPQVGGDSGDDDDDDSDDNDNGNREINANMPPIGTRVRRGPDWDPRFREQDSHGPGTVVSHGRDGILFWYSSFSILGIFRDRTSFESHNF